MVENRNIIMSRIVGFDLTSKKDISETPQLRKRTVRNVPAQEAKPDENQNAICDFLANKMQEVQKTYFLQGQDKCPICGGVVNYTYSKYDGFTVYECSKNDCLPWPDGGAKLRRESGQPQIVPTRYKNKEN
jgi:hypothetical protein